MKNNGTTYTAQITPEAWINDNAVEVDAPGPRTWTVSEALHDDAASIVAATGVDACDLLKNDPAAPQWVRDWQGPFTITVEPTPEPRGYSVPLVGAVLINDDGSITVTVDLRLSELDDAVRDAVDGWPLDAMTDEQIDADVATVKAALEADRVTVRAEAYVPTQIGHPIVLDPLGNGLGGGCVIEYGDPSMPDDDQGVWSMFSKKTTTKENH